MSEKPTGPEGERPIQHWAVEYKYKHVPGIYGWQFYGWWPTEADARLAMDGAPFKWKRIRPVMLLASKEGYMRLAYPECEQPSPPADPPAPPAYWPVKHQDTCAKWIRFRDNDCDCGAAPPSAEAAASEPPASLGQRIVEHMQASPPGIRSHLPADFVEKGSAPTRAEPTHAECRCACPRHPGKSCACPCVVHNDEYDAVLGKDTSPHGVCRRWMYIECGQQLPCQTKHDELDAGGLAERVKEETAPLLVKLHAAEGRARLAEEDRQVVCTKCGYVATSMRVRPTNEQVLGLLADKLTLERDLAQARAESKLYYCPECAFGFAAEHHDEGKPGEYTCPLCAETRLERELAAAREQAKRAEEERDTTQNNAALALKLTENQLAAVERENAALVAERDRLRIAFEKHATHLDCSSWNGLDTPRSEEKCDCGYRAALAPAEDAGKG